MKIHTLFLSLMLVLFAAAALKAETYSIAPENVLSGDLDIKPGETLDKSILLGNGHLVVEGSLIGNCIVTEGGSVTVKKGGHVYGAIISYGGPVDLGGEAYRIVSYKAPVLVSGLVINILAIETEVTLSGSAVVTGIISATSSKVITEPGASIKHPVHEQKPPYTGFPDYRIRKTTPNTLTVPGFAAALGLLLLIPVLFTRRSVAGSAIMLGESFWKSAVAGTAVCGILALLAVAGLKFPLLFPLAAPALGIALPALVIGCSAFCRMLGDKIMVVLGKTCEAPLFSVIAGYAALIAIAIAWVAFTILSHLAWIRPISANVLLGHVADVSGFLLVIAGMIGAGALAIITPFPVGRED